MAQKISYLGPKIWELLPRNIKDLEKLNIFKQILNFGSLKTVHAVCGGYILQT